MRREVLAVLLIVSALWLIVAGCASPSATPAPKPTSAPTSSPTPGKTTTPATKPTTTASPVSFAGKTITIVIPSSPGSGTDIVARVYARHLVKYLPGNPSIVIRSMTGGNFTICANYVYASKPDGLTLMFSAGGLQLAYATRAAAMKADLSKMEAILGTIQGGTFYARSEVVKRPEDIIPNASKVIYGGSSGSFGVIFITSMKILDFRPAKVTLGYPSSGDADRAFFAGEVNMGGQSNSGFLQIIGPYIQKGEVTPVYQSGVFDEKGDMVGDPTVSREIATLKEFYQKLYQKPPSGIAWEAYLGLVGASRSYDQGLWLPPGTPDNIVAAWRDAGAKMIKDPALLNDVPMKGSPWLAGKAFSDSFKQKMMISPQALDWLRATAAEFNVVF